MQPWPALKCLLLAVLLVCSDLHAGSVEGSIKLPPASTASKPSVAARYKNAPTGAVAAPEAPVAVVYLEAQPGTTLPSTPPAEAQLEQKGYQFNPGVLVVQKGAVVKFPNQDPDYHNVFSYSKPKRFDLGRYRKGEEPASQKFDQVGVVKLFCEIHEHMRGTILVVDTPYFTRVTDASGKFAINNVAPGRYTAKVWFEDKIISEKPVEISGDGPAKIDF